MNARDRVDELVVEAIEGVLDRLCEIQSRETEAAINASSCATSDDHRHAGQMRSALLDAREAATEALCQLLVDELASASPQSSAVLKTALD